MGGRVGASECRYPQTPEESIACSRTVATGDCEQLNMGAENQIQVLQKSNTHSELLSSLRLRSSPIVTCLL